MLPPQPLHVIPGEGEESVVNLTDEENGFLAFARNDWRLASRTDDPVTRHPEERMTPLARITILGAGDMGTALLTPLAANGHALSLWGTERDGDIIARLRRGEPHPRLGTPLPPGATAFVADQAADALAGAEIVVVAITSDAVRPVLARLGAQLGRPRAVVTVAKGFDAGPDGDRILLLPDVIAEFRAAPVVAVGGPSKANEVARGLPTAVTFGGADSTALGFCREAFATPTYRIAATDDIVGLEVAAAMKNAYAIALGVADGLEQATGLPHHNLRAALFPRAVAEMATLATALGGRADTVYGLAGMGDLQVTITAGRNRLLGERIGRGDDPTASYHSLTAGGTTIEGYPAVAFGHRLAHERIDAGTLAPGSLPLLNALWRVLYAGGPARETLWQAIG